MVVMKLTMNWYARHLTNHPVLIILGVLVITLVLMTISILLKGLPSFKDPLLGFEPRGTELSQRSAAWRHLLKDSGWKGSLSTHPSRASDQMSTTRRDFDNISSHSSSLLASRSSNTWVVLETEKDNLNDFLNSRSKLKDEMDDKWSSSSYEVSFFCKDPGRENVRVVFQSSTENPNLFTLQALLSICNVDSNQLRRGGHFSDLCTHNIDHDCCRSWSLPNYVALLSNRSLCNEITEEDVSYVLDLLTMCAEYYHDLKLSHDCTSNPVLCRGVPKECTRYNAVYNILHFLADSKFLGTKADDRSIKLTYTTVFLPIHQGVDSLDYYYDLQKKKLTDDITEVTGMEFGLKHTLLQHGLIHDTSFVVVSIVLIFLCVWMFTTSFLLTLMTILTVTSALGTTYFLYSVIYNISYFPLMNSLSLIVLIDLNIMDAFIYTKVWWTVKNDKSCGVTSKLVRDTLQQSCPSMFVNSITIAAALYSNVCSSVTVVRCFSIFTGTAVLVNLLLTLTWLPASIIVSDRWCTNTCCLCIPPFGVYLPYFQNFRWCSYICNRLWKFHYVFNDASRVFFEKILPCLVIKPRWFWFVTLLTVATGSAVIVFYKPSMLPPTSKEMQILGSEHPFEKYDLILKKYFWYEKASDHQTYHNLPIRIVWGVLPIDNGRYIDPRDHGDIVLDPAFHVSSRDSQKWLLSFCKELRNQTFYKTDRPVSGCFIETFKYWMERRCVDGVSHHNRTPCCQTSKFPYSPDVFNLCIREAIAILHFTPTYRFAPVVAGPRFSKETGDVQAVVVEYGSTVSSAGSYDEIKDFSNSVDSWMNSILKTAPPGMKNGWFVSDLDFYDLQDYLSRGTIITVAVAIGAISLSLVITTMNLMIAFCLAITITSVLLVTSASLVLLGWRLQAIETLLITITSALAVDLSSRYGTAYRNSPQDDRENAIVYGLSRLSSPVAMAAVTNFIAGIILLPTAIMVFLQIGIFLMIITTISWVYSTFFLHSLFSILSPCKDYFYSNQPTTQTDKTLYALSESTLSTSSVSCPSQVQISGDHHQLEPLSVNKIGGKQQRSVSRTERSGSLSIFRCEDTSWYGHPKRPSRKVSLPVVHVRNPVDPSPKHVSGATSASTLVGGDDDRDARKEPDDWPPTEILV